MRPYFQNMKPIGKPLTDKQREANLGNYKDIKEVERQVEEAIAKVKSAGIPEEQIHKRGQLTVWERIE
ncbi:MAG: glutaconyl-CoA decarboxylase subunit alpha, partial [Desulfatiglandales bacterium]